MTEYKSRGTNGLVMEEPLLIENSREGRSSYCLPKLDVPAPAPLEGSLAKEKAGVEGLPQLSEVEIVRHYFRLSQWNYNLDGGFYPLGSCTMKHNPKVNEKVARNGKLVNTHPLDPHSATQGNLRLVAELENALAEISGMDAVTVWPAAGAHGELTGIMIIRAYHIDKGKRRHKIIIPDTAHGTNPASSALAGFEVVGVKTGPDGYLLPETVAEIMDEDTAAIMITNPNTLGIFEAKIKEVAEIVHAKGGLVYMDGANLNALMGYVRPGDIGVDVMHFNLHKTFSTPHGGGGPGSGPVGVKSHLAAFLPTPIVKNEGGKFVVHYHAEKSIGRVRGAFGNFGIMLRAYAYITELGGAGLKASTEMAVLNANYIWNRLKGHYHLAYTGRPLHECVFSDKTQKDENDISNLDIVKRLIDKGYHPPTMSFPLIVHGALMIEPTETESKQEIDDFCDAMIQIAQEAKENAQTLKDSPKTAFRRRLDDVKAARKPVLTWFDLAENG